MIRLFTFSVSLICFLFCNAFGFSVVESDSTEEAEIQFVNMDITLSSKIIYFKWEVNTETNGDYFIIEKSVDRMNWVSVSRIKSIENHEDLHRYSVSEINFAESQNEYFRIQRVNKDGDSTVLDEVNINRPILSNMLVLMVPGKANKLMNISYDSFVKSAGRISVINEFGEEVFTKKITVIDGYNRILLNVGKYDKGNYSVILKDGYGNEIRRPLVVYGRLTKRR